MPFIRERPDLDKTLPMHANQMIWVMSAQGSAWFAGFILLNTRLGCLLVMIASPVFAVMYNLVEIIDYMEWEKTPPIPEGQEANADTPIFFGEEFWNKQKGHWPCPLYFNFIMTVLSTLMFILITIERSIQANEKAEERKKK